MPITFADISHHQDHVDLAAYKAAGLDRIALKATGGAIDGTLRFTDPTFAARWRQAGELGLARVAYHFARCNNTGAAEFDWFWSQVEAAGGLTDRDALCCDMEDDRGATTGDIGPNWKLARQRIREFTNRAVTRGHPHGWVYSGKWYFGPAGITAADLPPGWRNWWISDTTPERIELPPGWAPEQLVACQYTDHANLPGISGTDANFVIREWIDMTSPSNWTAADKAVVRALVDERLKGFVRALSTGQPNSVGSEQAFGELRRAVDAALADIAALKTTGGQVDPAALAAALVPHPRTAQVDRRCGNGSRFGQSVVIRVMKWRIWVRSVGVR